MNMASSISDMDKKQPYRDDYDSTHSSLQLPCNPDTACYSTTLSPPLPSIPSPSLKDKRPTNILPSAPSPFGSSFASCSVGAARVPSSSSSALSAWTKADEESVKRDYKAQEKLAKQQCKEADKDRKAQEKLAKQQYKTTSKSNKDQADEFTREIKHQASELKRELSHQTKEVVRIAKSEFANLNKELSKSYSSCSGSSSRSGSRSGCGSSVSSARAYPPTTDVVYQAFAPSPSPPLPQQQQHALQHERASRQCHYSKDHCRNQKRSDHHERRQHHRLERETRREQCHDRVPFPFGLATLGPRIVSSVVGGMTTSVTRALSGEKHPDQRPNNTIVVAPPPLTQGPVYPPQQPMYSPPARALPTQPMPHHYSQYAPLSQTQYSPNSKSDKSISPQDPLLVYSMSNLILRQSPSSSLSSTAASIPSAPPIPVIPSTPSAHPGQGQDDDDDLAPPSYEMATSLSPPPRH
ncbi:hypothetical protein BGX27_008107 [Mortierella sp. AM989]|nr:hypothetical protein BGX27_008107 [Mortierella sp. AM989]